MRAVWCTAFAFLAACSFRSRTNDAVDAVPPDDTRDAPAIDAPPPTGPFGTPIQIPELGTGDDPALTADLLEIYFNSSRVGGAGNGDVWRATRATASASWSTPMPVVELNTGTALESTPRVSADGLTMYFNRGVSGNYAIYRTSRASRSASWELPVLVTDLSTAAEDYGAAPNAAETRVVFNSNRDGSHDLFEATRASPSEPWGTAVALAPINSGANDYSPMLTTDGLTIYFHSERTGGAGSDLFVASRAPASAAFGSPARIVELNSGSADTDAWISPDQHTIVFASTRGGAQEFYIATR